MSRYTFSLDSADPRAEGDGRSKRGRIKLADGTIDTTDLAEAIRELYAKLRQYSPAMRASLARVTITLDG